MAAVTIERYNVHRPIELHENKLACSNCICRTDRHIYTQTHIYTDTYKYRPRAWLF